MNLTDAELRELQEKYAHLLNYESEDPESPIDPLTYVDSNGDTLLHIAAQHGDLRTLQLLLKTGMDVNKLGDMGSTALHYATTKDVTDFLLVHGASTKIRNEFGKLPGE